jgi:hypothetical protein
LTNRGSRSESHDKYPWLPAVRRVGNGRNTGSETKTLEHLMEDNGDQEDDEALGGDGNCHTLERSQWMSHEPLVHHI